MQDIKIDFRNFLRESKKTIMDDILMTKLDYNEAKKLFIMTKDYDDYLKMEELGLALLELLPENDTIEDELYLAKAQIIK